MSATITLLAPAKLTLTLRVVGVREDGYHLIDAEMLELDLADRLHVTPGADGIEIVGPFASGVPATPDNLVARALELVGRRAHVVIEKHIPSGGGLGGGSADAAAILRWAGWSDVAGAAQLGADVSFCLVGGRARVRGIGEDVTPLPPLPEEQSTFTLIVPPLHVSTPAVYRAWDALGGPRGEGPNDLEQAAIVVDPQLARWRDRIVDEIGETPILAGSGATWFVGGDRRDAAGALVGAAVLTARAAGR